MAMKQSRKNKNTGLTGIIISLTLLLAAVVLIVSASILILRDYQSSWTAENSLEFRKPEQNSRSEADTGNTSAENPYKQITISFIGDCMLASNHGFDGQNSFNLAADENDPKFFFEKVAQYFAEDDWTVANCENVFTDEQLPETPKNYTPAYWYRSKAANARIFTEGSVEIISLANNHTDDYGSAGAEHTKKAIEAAGLEWGNDSKPLILEKYGIRIGLYMTTMYSEWYANRIIDWLDEVKSETDYRIVYYHGGTERTYIPDSWRVRASKKMIDNGADLVIGVHPHVLQPIEYYNGKPIVNSLGNFIFGGSTRSDNRTIIYQIKLSVYEGEILSIGENIIPCYEFVTVKSNWQPVPIESDDPAYKMIMEFLNGDAESPK
ncbi:MAG: CapA family protein [Firmicutes bacterium]|nr:CapA family protein [Bacillota bacterium]